MRSDILQQAQAIRASMDAAAIVLTDEQAAKAPRLYPTWAAGLAVCAWIVEPVPGLDRQPCDPCGIEAWRFGRLLIRQHDRRSIHAGPDGLRLLQNICSHTLSSVSTPSSCKAALYSVISACACSIGVSTSTSSR